MEPNVSVLDLPRGHGHCSSTLSGHLNRKELKSLPCYHHVVYFKHHFDMGLVILYNEREEIRKRKCS